MRGIFAAIAGCVLAVSAIADDAKKMEGVWLPIGMELSGTKFSADMLKGVQLEITPGKYSLQMQNISDKGTLKLGEATTPKSIDIIGTEGPNKGKTYLAIYTFDGAALKICYSLDGKTRPTTFETTKANEYFLAVYEKKK
jgi:uncharacterized protein (TIGR03067 family)